ncbi:hypothetical protein KIPB_010455, partial [Kipferlia bialata]|eukprot:g10455.t1
MPLHHITSVCLVILCVSCVCVCSARDDMALRRERAQAQAQADMHRALVAKGEGDTGGYTFNSEHVQITTLNYPPYAFCEEGDLNPRGFVSDLMAKINGKMGTNLDVVCVGTGWEDTITR